MTTDTTIEELQAKAQLMAKYYFKGAGSSLQGIVAIAENDLRYGDDRDKARQLFADLENFTATIPFDELHEEEFYPLFVTRRLLTKLGLAMNGVFEQRKERALKPVMSLAMTVTQVGELYKDNLVDLLSKIRSMPGGEDFTVEVEDRHKEGTWILPMYT